MGAIVICLAHGRQQLDPLKCFFAQLRETYILAGQFAFEEEREIETCDLLRAAAAMRSQRKPEIPEETLMSTPCTSWLDNGSIETSTKDTNASHHLYER